MNPPRKLKLAYWLIGGAALSLYTTSGPAGGPMAFWWDILVRIFLETPELPDVLELDLGDTAASWRLGPDAIRTPEALTRAAARDADNGKPQDLRQAILVEVWSFVAGLPRGQRREAVSRILDWAGGPTVAAEGDIGGEEFERLISWMTGLPRPRRSGG